MTTPRSTWIFAFILLFAASVSGQDPRSTPTTPESDVVKISTNLIQLDVSVTDKKGNIVRDLRPEEVEIYENGKKQPITAFSFVSSMREITEETRPQPAAPGAVAVPVPPTTLRPDQVRRTVALIVDDLSLSFESTYYTRRALKKFVDEQMQEGDLVAIIRTGAGVGALQQFTSDKRLLYAAIDKVKWNPIGNKNVGAFAPIESKPPPVPGMPEPGAGERTAEGIEREFEDARRNYFTVGTLGALDYVIRGLGELPGRKSVVLFSHGFALTNVDAVGFRDTSPVFSYVRRLIDLANRSSVVIYSVDPRGLAVTGLTAADSTAGRSPEELRNVESQRSGELWETQSGLQLLSKETGGFAVVNNNDTVGAVRRVMNDQSYYLIGYDPGDDSFDPVARRYNRIEVKVLRDGVNVRYRSGFFNVEKREAPAETIASMSPARQIQSALVSPFGMSGITVRLNSLYANDPRTGNYVRSLLHIKASDLKFTEVNGKMKAAFDVLAASFGDNGQVVEQLGRSYELDLPKPAYEKIVRDGFVYHFLFPVKKPGAYQYRVAVRDPKAGTVGSASQFVEIPNLKKERLTLSSIVLENKTIENFNKQGSSVDDTNAMTDTSLRVFKPGTVLRYGYEVYNAVRQGSPQLFSKIRVFRDGKLVLDGKEIPVDLAGQTDLERIKVAGAITLGSAMEPGDYILQTIVIDKLAKTKRSVAAQFVQFELAP
jgi:VWFA-related protein